MKKLMGWLAFGIGIGIGGSLGWYVWTHLSSEAIAVLAGMGCASVSVVVVLVGSMTVLTLVTQPREKAPSPSVPLVG